MDIGQMILRIVLVWIVVIPSAWCLYLMLRSRDD